MLLMLTTRVLGRVMPSSGVVTFSAASGNAPAQLALYDVGHQVMVRLFGRDLSYTGGRWSPDGEMLLMSASINTERCSYLMRGNTITRLLVDGCTIIADWSPDSRWLAVVKMATNNPNNQPPVLILVDVIYGQTYDLETLDISSARMTWSSDSRTLVYAYETESGTVFTRYDTHTHEKRELIRHPDEIIVLRYSPTDTYLGFVIEAAERQDRQLYVMEADGSNVHQLTNQEPLGGILDWTADDSEITYWMPMMGGSVLLGRVTIDGQIPAFPVYLPSQSWQIVTLPAGDMVYVEQIGTRWNLVVEREDVPLRRVPLGEVFLSSLELRP